MSKGYETSPADKLEICRSAPGAGHSFSIDDVRVTLVLDRRPRTMTWANEIEGHLSPWGGNPVPLLVGFGIVSHGDAELFFKGLLHGRGGERGGKT
jgi:hypothetical protein